MGRFRAVGSGAVVAVRRGALTPGDAPGAPGRPHGAEGAFPAVGAASGGSRSGALLALLDESRRRGEFFLGAQSRSS